MTLLKELGYKESIKKPNLFYKNFDDSMIFFIDYRKKGYDNRPLFYIKPLIKVKDWLINRTAKRELRQLLRYKAYISMESIANFYYESDGYCELCGIDIKKEGVCKKCNKKRKKEWKLEFKKLKIIAKQIQCFICGKNPSIEEWGYIKPFHKHHIDYGKDETILICQSCHRKIHTKGTKENKLYAPKSISRKEYLELQKELNSQKRKEHRKRLNTRIYGGLQKRKHWKEVY